MKMYVSCMPIEISVQLEQHFLRIDQQRIEQQDARYSGHCGSLSSCSGERARVG